MTTHEFESQNQVLKSNVTILKDYLLIYKIMQKL